mgnify:CR=1 FL=1
MLAIRSLLFNAVFFGGGLVFALALLPFMVLPRAAMQWGLKLWSATMMGFLKFIVGLEWEVKGLENLLNVKIFDKSVYGMDHFPSVVNTGDVVAVVFVVMTISLLATIYPAWRAGRVPPVESLKTI